MEFNDSFVQAVSWEDVAKESAYVLFYQQSTMPKERLGRRPPSPSPDTPRIGPKLATKSPRLSPRLSPLVPRRDAPAAGESMAELRLAHKPALRGAKRKRSTLKRSTVSWEHFDAAPRRLRDDTEEALKAHGWRDQALQLAQRLLEATPALATDLPALLSNLKKDAISLIPNQCKKEIWQGVGTYVDALQER